MPVYTTSVYIRRMLSHPTCPVEFTDIDALLGAARASGARWPDYLAEEITDHDGTAALWQGRVFVTGRYHNHEQRLRYTVRLAVHGQFTARIMEQPIGRIDAFADLVAAHVAASCVAALHRDGFIPLVLHPADVERIARAAGFPDDAR